jgi:hypothetical protein
MANIDANGINGSWTWSRSRSLEADRILSRDLGSREIGTIEPLPGTEKLAPRSTPSTPSGNLGPITKGLSPISSR